MGAYTNMQTLCDKKVGDTLDKYEEETIDYIDI
jgi:hypothetical protein